MSKKKLLITFDAFGTLFTPKEPIAKQYVDVARKHGLESLDPKRIGVSFKTGKLEIQLIEMPTLYIDRSVFQPLIKSQYFIRIMEKLPA